MNELDLAGLLSKLLILLKPALVIVLMTFGRMYVGFINSRPWWQKRIILYATSGALSMFEGVTGINIGGFGDLTNMAVAGAAIDGFIAEGVWETWLKDALKSFKRYRADSSNRMVVSKGG